MGKYLFAGAALCLLLAVPLQAETLRERYQATVAKAQTGDRDAMYQVGQMYEMGHGIKRDMIEAMAWYQQAAAKEHGEAAYRLGYGYYWGKGVPKSHKVAHDWFLLAAEKGEEKAYSYLSKMYLLGQGVPADRTIARRWTEMRHANTSATKERLFSQ